MIKEQEEIVASDSSSISASTSISESPTSATSEKTDTFNNAEVKNSNDNSFAQYATMSAFVNLCQCEIYERVCNESLMIKEATTGYVDQESGNFVTYVIEFGVFEFK